jgi:hypothetical protein
LDVRSVFGYGFCTSHTALSPESGRTAGEPLNQKTRWIPAITIIVAVTAAIALLEAVIVCEGIGLSQQGL